MTGETNVEFSDYVMHLLRKIAALQGCSHAGASIFIARKLNGFTVSARTSTLFGYDTVSTYYVAASYGSKIIAVCDRSNTMQKLHCVSLELEDVIIMKTLDNELKLKQFAALLLQPALSDSSCIDLLGAYITMREANS